MSHSYYTATSGAGGGAGARVRDRAGASATTQAHNHLQPARGKQRVWATITADNLLTCKAPRFTGDYEAFHDAMVEYNNVMRQAARMVERRKDACKFDKAIDHYKRDLKQYNRIMEGYNGKRLRACGGWGVDGRDVAANQGMLVKHDLGVDKQMKARRAGGPRVSFAMRNFLTPTVCRKLIEVSERVGYREIVSQLQPSERNNTRMILSDPSLAAAVWPMVRDMVPRTLSGGNMLLYGVNDRFRFCRYHAGEKFEAHTDDVYRNADATLVSMLTLVIYLNDDYDGGNLNYLSARFPSSAATAASRDNIVKTVVPQVGLAVCFAHSLLHEGALIKRGVKYLLRTDVLYCKKGVARKAIKKL